MRAAVMALCLISVSVPCQAATFFEIGNVPTVAFGWENPNLALSLGLNARFNTFTVINPDGPEGPFPSDMTVVVFSPTVTGLLFLNQEHKAQGFIEMRAMKGLPIVSDNPNFHELYKETNDDWTLTAGGGLRSALAEHLSMGGAAEASFTFRTLPGFVANTDINASTGFRVFLQYHL